MVWLVFSPIFGKFSWRPSQRYGWSLFYLEKWRRKYRLGFTFVRNAPARLFIWFDLCSAPFLESSRKNLSNDMADHWFIFKNQVENTGIALRLFETLLRAYFCGLTHVQPHFWTVLVEAFPTIWLITGLSWKMKKKIQAWLYVCSKRSCKIIYMVWLMFCPIFGKFS